MEVVLIVLYAIPLVFVFCYSLIQLHLVYLYNKTNSPEPLPIKNQQHWPVVTIQLPVFNEKYVIERLIDCVAHIDYPKDKLEIQVLDDSTDESFQIAENKITFHKNNGIDIVHIKRPDRKGYKAGALEYGLNMSKGEYIAIFDADFMPQADFLKRTIPYFEDQNIGVVQTRWTHLNENESLLTKLQAFGLNAHFTVEQVGRNRGNHFINFNGTAGVWRKKCIEDAGGWSADTLTEDLDLSYRAQLKGWKFKYLESVQSPAELPVVMSALKGQQFRWTKGAAECAKKNLSKVWKQKSIPLITKLHSTFHLLNSSVFVGVLMMSLLSVPLLVVKENYPQYNTLFYIASGFIVSLLILIVFYWVAYRSYHAKSNILTFLVQFPLFLSISMGLSLHNAVAVIEGLLGRKTPFLRTPKFNNVEGATQVGKSKNVYITNSISWVNLLELVFIGYFLIGVYYAFKYNDFGLLPFHLLLLFGYIYVVLQTIIPWFKPLKNN